MSKIEISSVPPSSNTGVQSTSGSGLRACVDWAQGTLKNCTVEKLISKVLGLDIAKFVDQENGQFGYKKSKRFGSIVVYYEGHQDNMGVHFKMSGQGCREYEMLKTKTWPQLLAIVLENGQMTRLDLAIDDFKGYFKLSTVITKIKKGQLVSKFKSARQIEGIKIEDGRSKGKTVYFGADSSDIQIRMYDKKLEREGKGKKVTVDFWNRTEIQARDERANKIARFIVENGVNISDDGAHDNAEQSIGYITKGILLNYLRFVVKPKDGDRNKSRWKTAPFWDKFLGDVEKLTLTDVAPDRTLEKTIEWVDKQVSKSLAMMYVAYNNDPELILEIMQKGVEKLGDKERNILNRFYIENPDFVEKILEKKNLHFLEEIKEEGRNKERYEKMKNKMFDLMEENNELKKNKSYSEPTPYDFM